jgi:Zn-dependent protease
MFSGLSVFQLVVVLVSIIISMSIHEAIHGYVAHWLGDTTAYDEGRLTLNPLKHVDIITTVALPMILIIVGLPPIFVAKPVPFDPDRLRYGEFGMAMVGVAGPLSNLILAALAAVVFHAWGIDFGQNFYNALILFVQVNIAFFVFNMIPFPPLDGSRLLYAFAPEPLQDIMRQIESFGFVSILVVFLLVFQFISGPLLGIENFFVQLLLG